MKNDIIIIGAGPVGLAFALSLAKLGLKIIIVEKQEEILLASPLYDGREISLTHLSKHLMEKIGVWNRFGKEEISLVKEAKVLDGYSPYNMHFNCLEVYNDTLGYIVSNHKIRKALYDEAKLDKNIVLLCGKAPEEIKTSDQGASVLVDKKTIHASLIVAADNRFSESRRNIGISTKIHDFGRVAVLCKMSHTQYHYNTAYECFHYDGETLAVLPLHGNTSSVVVTVSTEKASSILKQSASTFNVDITEKFSRRFGAMELLSERFSYPLFATYADSFIAKRFALIGDAAVGMHPVTAHGFNFGLSSQNTLAMQISSALSSGKDFAADTVLAKYNTQHRMATKLLYLATNAIVKLYTDDRMIAKFFRKTLLHMGNLIAPARKAIIRKLTDVKQI